MRVERKHFLLDTPADYRIRVHGRLARYWADTLGGLAINVRCGAGKEPITTLRGAFTDQAALMGTLAALYDMGFTLIEVRRLPKTSEAPDADGQI